MVTEVTIRLSDWIGFVKDDSKIVDCRSQGEIEVRSSGEKSGG